MLEEIFFKNKEADQGFCCTTPVVQKDIYAGSFLE